MNLEEERDELKRDLRATQEMLFQVLYAVGEPIVVTKEQLERGINEYAEIIITENREDDSFVFSIMQRNEDES